MMPTAIGTAASASGANWSGLGDTRTIDGRAAIYESVATDWLKLSSFGLSPSGSVQGFSVEIEGSGTCGDPTNRSLDIGLSKDGGASVHGSLKTVTLPQSTDSTRTAGGASDLWGGSWSPSEVSSPTFCVLIKRSVVGPGQVRLDRVQVSVTYV